MPDTIRQFSSPVTLFRPSALARPCPRPWKTRRTTAVTHRNCGTMTRRQPDPRLMHQRSGLEGLSWRLARHPGCRQLPEILIQDRQEFLRRCRQGRAGVFGFMHGWIHAAQCLFPESPSGPVESPGGLSNSAIAAGDAAGPEEGKSKLRKHIRIQQATHIFRLRGAAFLRGGTSLLDTGHSDSTASQSPAAGIRRKITAPSSASNRTSRLSPGTARTSFAGSVSPRMASRVTIRVGHSHPDCIKSNLVLPLLLTSFNYWCGQLLLMRASHFS